MDAEAVPHKGPLGPDPNHPVDVDPPSAARTGWLWIAAATALGLPWLFVRFTTDFHHHPAVLNATLTGLAILSAAFLLSWAAEAFQLDVSQALALALLSLIAVLPEYAVDLVFAWRAGADPIECRMPEVLHGAKQVAITAAGQHTLYDVGAPVPAGLTPVTCQAPYAVANMTGSNRLLIGVGWSSVVLLAWWRARRQRAGLPAGAPDRPGQVVGDSVVLERGQALELAALAAATIYSFIIPLKGGIGPLDTIVLVSLFAVYIWGTARAPSEEPHLVGPAAAVGALTPALRRVATYGMFLWSAAVIFVSAEPFAEALVHSGQALGIDEFLLVQWLAPFASESPEFLVALLFAWRGMAGAGLRTLVASKVNQWTLLIGTLGAAYSLSFGALADLPLDARQTEELFLTSAQSLLALVLIANFDLSVREALFLLGTFTLQLFFPGTEVRLLMAVGYVVVSVGLLVRSRSRREMLRRLPAMIREVVTTQPPRPPTPATVAAEPAAAPPRPQRVV